MLVEGGADLMGRGRGGCARGLAREEKEEEEEGFFFFSAPTDRTLLEASLGISLSLEFSLEFSLGLFFPFAISYLGTRLASWSLPFDGSRVPELSVSKRDSTGRKPCGTETHEREDSNKEVREKEEGGEKTPPTLFFS